MPRYKVTLTEEENKLETLIRKGGTGYRKKTRAYFAEVE